MDVEAGVSGSLGVVEPVLVLRGRRPRRVGRRCGHHHEEWLVIGLVLEEVQRHVGLRGNRKTEQIRTELTEEEESATSSELKT